VIAHSLAMRIKRVLDVLVALVASLLVSPLLLVIAVLIKIDCRGPILFRQLRPGLRGKPFTLLKFRTMREATAPDGTLLPDARRLTRFGSSLRRTSLDELPELINVLRGEMSLVGPRPLLMQYLTRYSPEQHRRHEAKPGITGWAQVNGRNALTWEEKFRLDVWYVDNWSFALDLKILFMTLVKLFAREGISAAGHVTMPEFRGSGPSQG
jgi:sugar transferase EpsL